MGAVPQGSKSLKKTVAAALAAVVMSVAPPAEASDWNHPLPRELYQALSDCETGSNLAHISRTYVGPFGFTKTVFRWYSDTSVARAKTLTYAQHARIFDRAFFYGWRGRAPVGPWGHGCWKLWWKQSPKLRHTVCHNAKHQVRRWCR